VTKHREGTWAYVRLAVDDARAALVDAVLATVDQQDAIFAGDAARLATVRDRRAETAREYFERIAPVWDEERSLHASAADVEAAMLAALGDAPLGRVLDVGTGTGRIVQLLSPRADRTVGLDSSHSMLAVARANLERAGATDWELRQGDVHSPPLDPASFDLVVIHQVLHYLDDPARALDQAAGLVAPDGRLLVVDLAPHGHDFLRAAAHRRLGFPRELVTEWLGDAGLETTSVVDVEPPAADGGLTVTVWLARRRATRSARLVVA
jgi:ArsR family transcriptional regulator